MHPFTVKDTLSIILSFLSKEDRYALITSNERIRSLFSNVEFYELVGWQVLADEDHEEGLEYFKKYKALQESDIFLHYFDVEQIEKLKYCPRSISILGSSYVKESLRFKSYEMIKFIHEKVDVFILGINNLDSLKYALDNNIKIDFKESLPSLVYFDCLKFILEHFEFDHELLKEINLARCHNLEFFRFLEDIHGPEAMKKLVQNRGDIILNCYNLELSEYISNKYEVILTNQEILDCASLDSPYALELLSKMDVHSIDLSKINCSEFLIHDLPFCKKYFSEAQMKYLVDNLENLYFQNITLETLKTLEYLYKCAPEKTKKIFFREVQELFLNNYQDPEFYELLEFGINKGWLLSRKDRNKFLYKLFYRSPRNKLFTFCTVIKMIDPKVPIEDIVDYKVRKDGFDLLKKLSF